ncbi:UNVERIFIED_CONTAM: hypothetical protein GTU68_035459, partial [Idotea baltica]|nr:hypothetical protein [Idotea baltica]
FKLSYQNRNEKIKQVNEEFFDLIIVGGGITGAGIALDAITRGMKVALFEKQDFSAGTSSRSTKLIHGGLRYLKQLEIALVREVGLERALLHQNAPHIVVPENMLLPIVENGSLGKYSTSVGLYAYDMIAGVVRDERRTMHTTEETLELEPLVRAEGLLGSGLYSEYRSDDARLVIEVLKSAARRGVQCFNYTSVEEFIYEKEKVVGVKIKDLIQDESYEVKSHVVVNATGPWVDRLRGKDKSLKGKKLQLTKGVHLVVPFKKIPLKQSAYFDVGDGRMVFAIPRDGIVYLGTTDTAYATQIERPNVEQSDVDYILAAVNNMFPTINLKSKDVQSTWAGLRPLIHEEGKGPSELSRKDEIFFSPSGLISIAGGKLTGFRKMAERTVDEVDKALTEKGHIGWGDCRTDKIQLSGGILKDKTAQEWIGDIVNKYKKLEISPEIIQRLFYRYGTNTVKILNQYRRNLDNRQKLETQLLKAEAAYCVENEMICNLSDFLIRRTGNLYFNRPKINSYYKSLSTWAKNYFDWNSEQIAKEKDVFDTEVKDVLNF